MRIIILLFIVGLSAGFISDNPIIDSALSKYNGLIIGQSKLDDIKSTYGLRCEINKRAYSLRLQNRENERVIFHQISYPKKGIKFIIFSDNLDEGTIDKIIFFHPFKGKTDKDIVIGKSTFGDVIKRYGLGFWNSGNIFYSRKLSLSYGNITFKTDMGILDHELKDEDYNDFSKLVITEIELHLNRTEE